MDAPREARYAGAGRSIMETRHGRAPSYAQLRPIKGTTPTFPVYGDLVAKLTRVPRGT
jgi:hypothetical protein